MICSRCGSNVPDGMNFCTNCGADLRRQAAAPAAAPVQQPAQPQQPPYAQQPYPQQPAYARQPAPAQAAQAADALKTTMGRQGAEAPQAGRFDPAAQRPVQQPVNPAPQQHPNQQPMAQQPIQRPAQQPVNPAPQQHPNQQPMAQQPIQRPVQQQAAQRPMNPQPMQQHPNQQPTAQQPIQRPMAQQPVNPQPMQQRPVQQPVQAQPVTVPSAEVLRARAAEAARPEAPARAEAPAEPAKKKGSKGLLVGFIIVLVLALALAALNVVQYFGLLPFGQDKGSDEEEVTFTDAAGKEYNAEDMVAKLQEEKTGLTTQLEQAKGEAAEARQSLEAIQPKADRYDSVTDFLGTGAPHIGSEEFFADVPALVLHAGDAPSYFTVTADFSQGATVSFSAASNVAKFEWTESSWATSTQIKVTPVAAGTTIISFTNSLNSATFQVMVIVTD